MSGEVVDARIPRKLNVGLVMKYFVLNPTKRGPYGKASRAAIYEYARFIETTNRVLAKDLRDWMDKIK